MIPLPSIPGEHSALIPVVAVALAVLAVTWIVPPSFGRTLYRLLRLVWWVIVRPKLSVPLAALGLVSWLAWPILGPLSGSTSGVMPFVALGVVGALTCGLLVAPALRQQRRINADIEAQYAADDAVDSNGATALPEWARE